jgi:hypothetical protein
MLVDLFVRSVLQIRCVMFNGGLDPGARSFLRLQLRLLRFILFIIEGNLVSGDTFSQG